MKRWLITFLGGFNDIDEVIAHIKSSNDEQAKFKILTEAVAHLFNGITSQDILREENGQMIFRGRPITQSEKDLIEAEAKQFMNSTFWRILRMDIRWQINKKLFVDANTNTDIVWGKLLVFYDDIIKTRLYQLTGKKIDTVL